MFVSLGWMLLTSLPLPNPTPSHLVEPPRSIRHHAWSAGRVNVWTDREDPYRRGEAARIFLDVDEAAYVTVLRVDTDGRIRMLFPREPWGDTYVQAEQTFEVSGSRGGRSFVVDDYPGVGYLFAIASPDPFDYNAITRGDYWDYRLVDEGRIQGDPYVVLTDLAERIAPGGHYDYDITPYYVDNRYDYPRFVCYDCHAYATYREWDPYRTPCTRFRMVVYDDPRYYPYRYGRGRNVVTQRPLHLGPRFVFRDADPSSTYLTRVPRRPGEERRRGTPDRDRTSEDVGGPGAVPAPGVSSLGRGRFRERPPQLSPARPLMEERRRMVRRREQVDSTAEAPEGLHPVPERQRYAPAPRSNQAPRSTGEPELRRRRP
jgi:Domain of unknown function (DUF4384)